MRRQKNFLLWCLFSGLFISCQSQDVPAVKALSPNYFSIGITGSSEDVQTTTSSGIVLMGGGTDVDAAIQWMITKSGGGDFIILRASGSTGYNDYIYGLGKLNSVETLLLDAKEKANSADVGKRIREAEALFIAGGDQSNYANFWSDTEVDKALHYLIHDKKIPVGGTSAGCAVLSQLIFDARQGSVTSAEALLNPYTPLVSLSKSFIDIPYLSNTIADQHYSQRTREGRHMVFLARLKKELGIARPKGIGVDEKTAVCLDENGDATMYGSGNAYFLMAEENEPEVCSQGKPLTWNSDGKAVRTTIITATLGGTDAFNLNQWPTTFDEWWSVDSGVLIKKAK